jgi:hypothetical protein
MELEGAGLPYFVHYDLPPVAVLYVVGLALVAAVISGVLPALKATGRRVQSTLRYLSGGGSGLRFGRTWTGLIVAQTGLAVVALPAAVAMGWSEVRLVINKPVFAVEQFLAASFVMDPEPPSDVDPAAYRSRLRSRSQQVQNDVIARLESESWVSDVAIAMRPPGQEVRIAIEVEAAAAEQNRPRFDARANQVDIDFFDVFDARVLAGRVFTAADRVGPPDATGMAALQSPVVVVNRTFAQRVFGDSQVVGRRIRRAPTAADGSVDAPWAEIAGVIGDLHTNPLDSGVVVPVVYHLIAPGTSDAGSIVIRVAGGTPASYVGRLRELTADVDPTVRLSAYPLVDIYRQANVALRLVAVAIGLIVVSVLLLSAAGVYALMSFTVAQRRKEIGIRAALGADSRQILRSIFARAATQLGTGIAVGVGAAALIDYFSGGEMLAGTAVVLLPGVSVVMVCVGLLASLGPARRGLRVHPTEALREE